MNNLSSVSLTSLMSAYTSAGSRSVSLAPCPECGVLCLKEEQGAGSREQGAGSREQGAGSREQGAGSREQGAGSREQGA
ncbi:MAG: hypothetical protein LBQ31_01500, partial [Bacteroidales bacterium]|nr:hypothetical protein [Bacteroidales bacterium]